jgi:hypothetical protein
MLNWVQDLRYALRQLWKAPGFVATVVITQALGIGMNTAIFSLIHAVLLKSLPVTDPAQIYRVGDRDSCCWSGGLQYPEWAFFTYELYKQFKSNDHVPVTNSPKKNSACPLASVRRTHNSANSALVAARSSNGSRAIRNQT